MNCKLSQYLPAWMRDGVPGEPPAANRQTKRQSPNVAPESRLGRFPGIRLTPRQEETLREIARGQMVIKDYKCANTHTNLQQLHFDILGSILGSCQ